MKKYICIKQHDETDCGAACLATVSKQYGFTTSITKIRELAGTDKQGTNVYANPGMILYILFCLVMVAVNLFIQ